MSYAEFDGKLDGEESTVGYVPFDGEMDSPKGMLARAKDAVTGFVDGVGETAEALSNSFQRGIPSLKTNVYALNASHMQGNVADIDRFNERIAQGPITEEELNNLPQSGMLKTMSKEDRLALRDQYTKRTDASVTGVVRNSAERAAMPNPEVVQKVMNSPTFGAAFDAFRESPIDFIAAVGPESLIQSLPGLAAAIPASAVAGVPGGMTAIGVNSFAGDYASGIMEGLQEEGIQVNNAAALKAAVSNPELMSRVKERAAKHAAVVGAFDAVSAGMASKTLLPGVVARKLAGRPVATQAANVAVQMPAQAALGAAGEAGGSIASGQEIKPGAVLAEAAGELFGAPAEIAAMAKSGLSTKPTPTIEDIGNAHNVDEAITAAQAVADTPSQSSQQQSIAELETSAVLGTGMINAKSTYADMDAVDQLAKVAEAAGIEALDSQPAIPTQEDLSQQDNIASAMAAAPKPPQDIIIQNAETRQIEAPSLPMLDRQLAARRKQANGELLTSMEAAFANMPLQEANPDAKIEIPQESRRRILTPVSKRAEMFNDASTAPAALPVENTVVESPVNTAERTPSSVTAVQAPEIDAKLSENVVSKPAEQKTASWVIREKSTGNVIMETFDRKKVNALNIDKYEAVPIREHLAGLNAVKPESANGTKASPPVELKPAKVEKPLSEKQLQRQTKTAELEKATNKELRTIAGNKNQPAYMKNAASEILQVRDQVNRSKRSDIAKKVYAKSRNIDPDRDTMAQAIAKLGGINRESAAGRLRLAPEELNRRGAGLRPLFHANGRSMDEIGAQLADLGYVQRDENGKHDQTDFEDKLAEVAGGSEVLTPNAMMTRAQEEQAQAMQEVGAQTAEDYTEVESHADFIEELDSDIPFDLDDARTIATAALTNEEIDGLFETGTQQESNRLSEDAGTRDAGESGQGTEAPDFSLEAESETEAREKLEEAEAQTRAKELELKRLDEQDKQARIQKEIDARQDASAENFQLGQSSEDSLAGQGDIFSQPEPVAAPKEMKKGDRFTDGSGKTWEVWMARTSLIEAFPVINGNIKVNNADGQRWATDERARFANPEARTDFTPLAKEKKPITPQVGWGSDVAPMQGAQAQPEPRDTKKDERLTPISKREPAESIQDIGEKIGGARKDLVVSTGQRASKEPVKDVPTWRKRFEIQQIVSESHQPWVILDKRTDKSMRQGYKIMEFSTEEAAEKAIPLAAVAQKHRVVQAGRGEAQSYEIWRDVTEHKRIKVVDQQFATRDDAMRYMAEHATDILDTKTSFGEEILAKPDTVNRTGPDRREGDVKGSDFKDVFGFRGVEFGNWNNQEERQQVLNHAYDGLLDLAEVLGIPPKALSLNGDLAIAFGSRGHGLTGARAHYERNYGVINLTKMEGAGALAHEWFHGFDHYIGRLDGKASSGKIQNKLGDSVFDASGREKDYASHGFLYQSKARPEVVAAYSDLIKGMFAKAEKYVEDTDKTEKFVARTRDDLRSKLNDIRADMAMQQDPNYYKRNNKPATSEQLTAFDAIADKLVNGEGLATSWVLKDPGANSRTISGRHSNESLEAISAILKAVRGRTGFNADHKGVLDSLRSYLSRYEQRIKMLNDATSGDEKSKKVPTSFAMDAKSIDQGRATDYWTTPHEMAARAFSAYVEDKLAAQGNKSEFLSYGSNNNMPEYRMMKVRPFPEGEERVSINKGFDKLIKTLETKETDKGTALYDRGGLFSIGMEIGEVQSEVDRLSAKWANAPKINVVASAYDLPLPAPSDARGAYYRGQVWLVAENNRDAADVQFVLFHETMGHAGLRGMFGDRIATEMQYIGMKNENVRKSATKWRAQNADIRGNRSDAQWNAISIEESLADIAGSGREIKGIEKLLAFIQTKLRAMGMNSVADWMESKTDAEVLKVLADARKSIEQGDQHSIFGAQEAQAYQRQSDPKLSRNEEENAELLANNPEEIIIKAPIASKEEIDEAAHIFLSAFAESGTRYDRTSATARKAKAASLLASDDIGYSPTTRRRVDASLGHFSGYSTTARIDQSFDGKPMLVIGLVGKEQAQEGLGEQLALRIEVDETGGFSIYGPPSDSRTYKEFVKRGWAEPAKGEDGSTQYITDESGSFWTRLTGVSRAELIPLMGDIHARVLAWKGEEHTGLHWQRMTGATGGINGRTSAIYFSRTNQTATPAFKKWFGDSKVVDAEGKPLVVYHGTDKSFDSFDVEAERSVQADTGAQGFYFTKYAEDASGYAGGRKNREGANVVATYVSLKNPLVLGEADIAPSIVSAARRAELEAQGYDGIIYRDGEEVVAFHPEQIKSATGNNGDFDGENSDIRFSRASNVQSSWMADAPSKLDDFIYVMQDKQVDTRRVVQAIRDTMGTIQDNWNVYLQEELFHGRSAKQVTDFLGSELKPLLTEMQARGVKVEDFEQYLHMRHAEERNNQIAKVNPAMQDGGSGIDTADARAYLSGLNQTQRTAFQALAKRIDAINTATRQILIDSGLEKPETIAAWEGAYQYYVPLQREEAGQGIGQGFSVRGSSSKRAMGSKKAVINILANLSMQRERTIVRAEKNRVSTALYGLAITAPNPEFWQPVNPDKIDASKQAELVSLGLNPLDVKNLIDEPKQQYIDPRTGLVAERINPFLRSAPNVMSTRVNGEDRYVFFSESDERATRMVKALKNLDADQLGRILSMSAKVTRYFSAINTQYNPIFGIINLTRDVQGALLNLSTTPIAGKQKEVAAHTASALRGIYIDVRDHRAGKTPTSSWAALYEEFQNAGGQTGYRNMFSNSQERADALQRELSKISEGKLKMAGRAVFDWLSDYNETMENSVRLAAYKVAKDQGLSIQQAASMAKNLTVNFNRKGQVATQAGSLYAFFNASVQGTTRLAETLSGPTGKKIIAGGLLLGSMQAMMLAFAGFDDDEPPEFIRSRNVIIPIGNGKYLTLPMPLGFNLLPSIARIPTEFVLSGFKNPGKRLVSFLDLFADTFNPIGNAGFSLQTIAPTAIDPFAALSENRDWTGKPIAREQRSGLAPSPGHTRAKDTASELSKALSYGLNAVSGGTKYKPGIVSPTPDQLDYLIAQATGGVGREAIKVEQTVLSTISGEDLPAYKIPLVGRFYGNTKEQAGASAKFYDNLKTINEHEAEIKGRRKDRGDVVGYIRDNPESRLVQTANNVERDLQKLRQRKRDMLDRGASKDSLKLVEQQMSNRMNAFNDRVRAVAEKEKVTESD